MPERDTTANLDCAEESFAASPRIDLICLFLLAALLACWGLASGPGLSDHEALVSQAARDMRVAGHWAVPEVNGVPFIRKPPMASWLVGFSSILVDPPRVDPPVSPMASRLPSALALVGTVFVVYGVGRSMFGHRAALMSGAALATSAGGLFFSHNAQVEMVLIFFCAACYACFWLGTEADRRRGLFMTLFYVACAGAMMSKAPLPLAVVGLPLAVWWFFVGPFLAPREGGSTWMAGVFGQVVRFPKLRVISGTVLFLLLFAPWPYYVYRNIDNAVDLWRIEFFARYSGDLSDSTRPPWYYLPIVLGLAFPYSLSIPEAVASPFMRRYRAYRRPLAFALTWAAVHVIFVSTSSFKRPHYVATTLPAFALLLGPVLEQLFLSARTFSRRAVQLAVGAIVVAAPVGLFVGMHFVRRDYPAAYPAYVGGAVIAGVGVIAGAIAFLRRQRAASFLTLVATVALGFSWAWTALGQNDALQSQAFDMVDRMRACRIPAETPIVWVLGRPDSRLPYYLGRDVEPLFNELELAPRRESRSEISADLMREGLDRLTERLEGAQRAYFILDAHHWDRLRARVDAPMIEVFTIEGEHPDKTRDDWVFFTNQPLPGASGP